MSLVCLSFSHKHVPISIREKLFLDSFFNSNALSGFRFWSQCKEYRATGFPEIVVLSTCNRTEVYAYFDSAGSADAGHSSAISENVSEQLLDFISESSGLAADNLKELAEWFFDSVVIRHLGRVACGLESQVLGEPQILGQVGDALRSALTLNSCGSVLTKLFQSAIKAGRRAQNETQINRHSQNFATIAVNTAIGKLESLANKNVVLLGAGTMAELVVQQLCKKGVGKIGVVNRTLDSADTVAGKYGGRAFVFEQIANVLSDADLMIASTSAPHTLIHRSLMETVMKGRLDRQLVIIDLAVPRDVEPAVGELPNVFRCDIDDLSMVAEESIATRQKQVPHVEAIIEDETQSFMNWFRSAGVEPTIASFRLKAEQIRSQELGRLRSQLQNVEDDEVIEIVERFSKSLLSRLLHEPTQQLRQHYGKRGAIDHAEVVRELFLLEVKSVAGLRHSESSVSQHESNPCG